MEQKQSCTSDVELIMMCAMES